MMRSVLLLPICLLFTGIWQFLALAAPEDVFHYAQDGNVPEVAELISSNPQLINLHNEKGFTPFLLAAAYGHPELVSYLLEHGANVNDAEHDDWTALMFAAHSVC